MSDKQEFSKIRSLLWPVHAFELKKLIPMLMMFFCISFNYTILRDTKDTLVVTGSGAETIAFLKVWGVVPCAFIFMLVYSKLSNILSKENLFYSVIAFFIAFFALFALVLYPYREALHPVEFADTLQSVLPKGFSGLVSIIRNWTYSLFYILAEIWGSAVLSLMFWGFANDITKVSEAGRFYSLFGIGANIALMVSGPSIAYVSDIRRTLPPEADAWGVSLNYLMTMVVIAGFCIMAVYWYMNKHVLTDPRFYNPEEVKTKKKKPKMGVGESMRYLLGSKYILCLATLVACYGMSINLIEITWKDRLKTLYPDPNDYSTFMGWFSFSTGVITVLMMLFVGGNAIRLGGWRFAAMITPIVLAITGVAFFSFILFDDVMTGMAAYFSSTPLMLAVLCGAAQNIMSKSAKYSLFDPTKEMAYIPLDVEMKVKGKAAVDVVGARLGKSGGALTQQILILAFGSVAAITPYVAVIMVVVVGAWILAVRALSIEFNALTNTKKETEGDLKPQKA